MKEINVKNSKSDDLLKVIVNDDGDAIYINPNDGAFIEKFASFLNWLTAEEKRLTELAEAKDKEYDGKPMVTTDDDGNATIDTAQFLDYATITTAALEEAAERIDTLFGQDALRKYYKAFYAINPDFLPDADCINDFVDAILPPINAAYDARMARISSKYAKNRRGGRK